MPSLSLSDSWIRRLFFTLAVLYVLPFWTVRYLPTTDGPAHVYNAWVLRQHANVEQYPLFHQYYVIKWLPYPNWTSHAVMALLMFVVPPLIAEKLLVSGYVLLFLAGAWYLAGAVRPDERWPAFLAFPFVYNLLFQFGFYNFSISLGCFFFVLGYWWRHRERPDLRFAVRINLLLLLCWFSHILSFCLALLAISVLWLATLRRTSWWRHLLHVPILAPQIVLPLWFIRQQEGGAQPAGLSLHDLWSYLVWPQPLFVWSDWQVYLARLVAWVFGLLLLLTLWRWISRKDGRLRPSLQEADVFLLLAAGGLLLYFFAPATMSGGSMVIERLSLYPYLLLIPWFAPRLGPRSRTAAVAALALLAAFHLGYLIRWYRVLGEEVRQFVAGLEAVQPGSRVLSLLFNRHFASQRSDVFGHAMGYVALEKGLIDWDNYEARMTYFPIHFRDGVSLPQLTEVLYEPGGLRVRVNRETIDAIYTWQMPADAPLRRRLQRDYVKVSEKYGGELHQRRPPRHGKN
ncbi:MAG: hypothetical protein QOF89_4540 [Acidobacteriota bacterium]|jgi:hypothetical protein|nr:hypothetical protein [Acidobacteriota bacterium]